MRHAADTRLLDAPVRTMARLVRGGRAVEVCLVDLLAGEVGVVGEAMRYAALPRAGRIRGLLLLECCVLAGGRGRRALSAACAVEMVHTAACLHDARGAACRETYGEEVAARAAEALRARALSVVSLAPGPPERRLRAVATLATAIGSHGMARGSGVALARATCVLGGVMAGARHEDRRLLGELGQALGEAAGAPDSLALEARVDGALDAMEARFGRRVGAIEVLAERLVREG